MKCFLILFIFALNCTAVAQDFIPELKSLPPSEQAVREDLALILEAAHLPSSIDFSVTTGLQNKATLQCQAQKIRIQVEGDQAWGQTFYMTLQRLGFLFPHPMTQISPTLAEIRKNCGRTFYWKPALKYAGFHFHTLHPNEWVRGFLEGDLDLATHTVRWLARNQQNIFDLSLLDLNDEMIFKNLAQPFALAKKLGIHAGVTLGIALHQQKSYKLVSLPASFFGAWSAKQIDQKLGKLLGNLDISFVNAEAGTSEFTSVNYKRAIAWMNQMAALCKKRNVALLVKVHASSNQHDAVYGNFNFLPQHASREVGILPHTVFLYGINDEVAPMYGNKNFYAIRDFMLQEKSKRRTWFYPESSYYLGLDIDAPLLLTDYLLTRSNDTKFLHDHGIEGQLNFSTGQELGYWLFDWTYTLLNNTDYAFDPKIGLKLLGEDLGSWQKIIDFQHEYFIKKGLISVVTFPNMGEELMPGLQKILKRNSIKDLKSDPNALATEIQLCQEAIAHLPSGLVFKNQELKILWDITRLRIFHALNNRMALAHASEKDKYLAEAAKYQSDAQAQVDMLFKNFNRYPEAQLFEKNKNPTAYQFGYAYTVKNLHYWERESQVVKTENFSPFFMALHSIGELIRGWVL